MGSTGYRAHESFPLMEMTLGLFNTHALWRDLFSRAITRHGTGVEVFRDLLAEEQTKPNYGEATKAAFVYLALA
jgi:hypothetical protein